MNQFHGIFTPICTPFDQDQRIDQKALSKLLEFQMANGIHGIITCAGTGQFSALSFEERVLVTQMAVAIVDHRVPVLAHTGSCSTADAVSLSKRAMDTGADGLLVSPPYYEIPTENELFTYFETICHSVSLPIMVYNNPYASKVDLGLSLLRRLCKIENVKMVKEAAGDLVQFQRMVAEFRDRFAIFTGWDTGAFATLVQGASGCAWGAANAVPRACVELYRLIAERGDIPKALALWDKLFPVNDFFETQGYASSIKSATAFAGVDLGGSRPPLSDLANAKLGELETLLSSLQETVENI